MIDLRAIGQDHVANGAFVLVVTIGLECDFFTDGKVCDCVLGAPINHFHIGDDLSSREAAVNTGDEVRWINKRTALVRIIFLDPVLDKQLSCNNNFGGWMTPSDTAHLGKNETASACFRDPGYFRYIVRMESALTTGDINIQGVIKVGGQGGQAAAQTSDQNRGRTSGQTSDRTIDQNTGQTSDQPSGKTSSPRSSTSTTTSTTTTTDGASGPIY